MGMYDTIWVECPECKVEHGLQTKSGSCILANYNLDKAPNMELLNVNRHAPFKCDCGITFEIDIEKRKPIKL